MMSPSAMLLASLRALNIKHATCKCTMKRLRRDSPVLRTERNSRTTASLRAKSADRSADQYVEAVRRRRALRLPARGGDCPRQSDDGRRWCLRCGDQSAPVTGERVRCECVTRAASLLRDAFDAYLVRARLLRSALRCRSSTDGRDRTAAACGEVLLMRSCDGSFEADPTDVGFLDDFFPMAGSPKHRDGAWMASKSPGSISAGNPARQ